MSKFIYIYSILGIYTVFRFIFKSKFKWLLKLLFSLMILIGSQILTIFRYIGGHWFAPNLATYQMHILIFLFNFFFISTLLCAFKDILSIPELFIRKVFRNKFKFFSHKVFSSILIIISLIISGKSYYNVIKSPTYNNITIQVNNLPKEFENLKIVQLTDIHASMLNTKSLIQKIVNKTNELEPDLILITGDFVDGSIQMLRDTLDPLSNLKSKYGIYAVDGNHEAYSGYNTWINKIESYNIKFLNNSSETIKINDNPIKLVGIKDGSIAPNLTKENILTIAMCHRPKFTEEISKFADIQLSGHTHGGMIKYIIAPIVAKANDGFVSGLYQINDMSLYVSNGTNLWCGFPIRIGIPSEITIFKLESK